MRKEDDYIKGYVDSLSVAAGARVGYLLGNQPDVFNRLFACVLARREEIARSVDNSEDGAVDPYIEFCETDDVITLRHIAEVERLIDLSCITTTVIDDVMELVLGMSDESVYFVTAICETCRHSYEHLCADAMSVRGPLH